MQGAALTWTILTLVVWAHHLPPPASSASSSTFSTSVAPLRPVPHTLHTLQTPKSSPRGLQLVNDGHVGSGAGRGYLDSSVSRIVEEHGYDDEESLNTTVGVGGDLYLNVTVNKKAATQFLLPSIGSVHLSDGVSGQVRRSAPPFFPSSTTTVASTTAAAHRHRHHHAAAPLWLKPHLDSLLAARSSSAARRFEEEIASVFRGVAYGGSSSYRSVPLRRQDTREIQAAPRIERTTAVGEEPLSDYLNDGGSGVVDGGRNVSTVVPVRRNVTREEATGVSGREAVASQSPKAGNTTLPDETKFLELHEYDSETYDQYEGHYADLSDHRPPEAPGRDNTSLRLTSPVDEVTNATETPPSTTTAAPIVTTTTTTTSASHMSLPRHTPRLSWLDVLRCTNHGLAWVLINFFLGFLLLLISLLGPYRLLTMRCCTPLLPRTHYVAVHLLVFVAASLKAVYLFHLAFGSRGRLPLILLLLLTNTGFPCLSSAFLVLMMMMFVAADIQVYKSKLCTAHNTFVFVVVMLSLAFVADVIVGCAHSRSVLVLSRVMVIAVASAAVLIFIRKQQSVLDVSQMMKREFQGELKLLVLPAKDDSLTRQMGLKHILRSRLGQWCRTVRVSAAALALLSLVHLLHTVFLVSATVPAWAWWLFHVTGCLVEALLSVSLYVAAALTQRYDESVSFPYSFMLPPILVRSKSGTDSTSGEAAAVNNAEAIYQRVSFSSGTESTHYTSCYPEAALACTPQAPRRRGAPVKRSATFSHAPQVPHAATHVYGSAAGPLQVMRVGSASNLPLYGPPMARGGMYGSGVPPRGPPYVPASDASVLVHEDGFVRVRTPMDPREVAPHPHGSLIMLQQAHFRGSSPHLRGAAGPEVPSRNDSLYQGLSRTRKSSRGADVLQNNIDLSESEYQSSPSRASYGRHSNLPSPNTPARDEADYRSLSRRSGRRHHAEGDNYDYHSLSWRRGSRRDPGDTHLNNLNRPESDYRSLARRQVSREDNNDPVHHHHHHHDPGHYASRRGSRDSRAPPLNVYEEQDAHARPSTLDSSPCQTHKVTNRPFSPSSPSTSPGHASHMVPSPRPKREARFPKPFVRIGSNMSLQGDDLYYYGDYIPRGNPVRRNHSSAGYYPSRYMTPSTPSLVEAQRYGSLRLSKTRKRQPHYVFTPDGKLLNRHPEEWSRDRRTASPDDPRAGVNGPEEGEGEEGGAAPTRECPSRQSTSSKRSDEDWAIELIKSSSMLTDFYSLTPDQKKARRKEKEKEKKEEEILEEQEE